MAYKSNGITISTYKNGTSPYIISLDNDSATIGTDKEGKNYSINTLKKVSTINVSVQFGKDDITNDCEFTWTPSNCTLVGNGVAGSSKTCKWLTAIDNGVDSATVSIGVELKGEPIGLPKIFTITKTKQGETGSDAVTYDFSVTPNTWSWDTSPAVIPVFSVIKHVGENSSPAPTDEYQIGKSGESQAWVQDNPITDTTTFELYIKDSNEDFSIKAGSETVDRNGGNAAAKAGYTELTREYGWTDKGDDGIYWENLILPETETAWTISTDTTSSGKTKARNMNQGLANGDLFYIKGKITDISNTLQPIRVYCYFNRLGERANGQQTLECSIAYHTGESGKTDFNLTASSYVLQKSNAGGYKNTILLTLDTDIPGLYTWKKGSSIIEGKSGKTCEVSAPGTYTVTCGAWSDTVIISEGLDGTNGTNGTNGRGISNIQDYFQVTSTNSPPGRYSQGTTVDSKWKTSLSEAQPSERSPYLWNFERTKYTSSPLFEDTDVTLLSSTPRAIEEIKEYYAKQGTAAPSWQSGDTDHNEYPVTDGWSTSVPSLNQGDELLNCEVIKYTATDKDGKNLYAMVSPATVGYIAHDGPTGIRGAKTEAIRIYCDATELKSPSAPTGSSLGNWKETLLSVSKDKPYVYSTTGTKTTTYASAEDTTGSTSYNNNWGKVELYSAWPGEGSGVRPEEYAIFLQATKGDNQGIFKSSDGKTYINAEMIQTGTLQVKKDEKVIFSAALDGDNKGLVTIGGWKSGWISTNASNPNANGVSALFAGASNDGTADGTKLSTGMASPVTTQGDSGIGSVAFWAGCPNGTPWTNSTYQNETPFYVTNKGVLKSTSGTIGGWEITADNIKKGTLTLHSDSIFKDSLVSSASPSPVRISCGQYTRKGPYKKIFKYSDCIRKNFDSGANLGLEITGTPRVTETTLVTFEDPNYVLEYVGTVQEDDGLFIELYCSFLEDWSDNPNNFFSISFDCDYEDNYFQLLNDGSLYASAAQISGRIEASEGKIGGWEIGQQQLVAINKNNEELAVLSPTQFVIKKPGFSFMIGNASIHMNEGSSKVNLSTNTEFEIGNFNASLIFGKEGEAAEEVEYVPELTYKFNGTEGAADFSASINFGQALMYTRTVELKVFVHYIGGTNNELESYTEVVNPGQEQVTIALNDDLYAGLDPDIVNYFGVLVTIYKENQIKDSINTFSCKSEWWNKEVTEELDPFKQTKASNVPIVCKGSIVPEGYGTSYLGDSTNYFANIYSKTLTAHNVIIGGGTGEGSIEWSAFMNRACFYGGIEVQNTFNGWEPLFTNGTATAFTSHIDSWARSSIFSTAGYSKYSVKSSSPFIFVTHSNQTMAASVFYVDYGGNMKAGNGTFTGTVYTASGSVSKSDRNAKNTILPLDLKYEQLFDTIQPISHKYNDGTSNRTHIGVIAQEVEKAILEAGLTTQECAIVCYNIDEETGQKKDYGVRYTEIVPLNTWQIQKLKPRMAAAEEKIHQLEDEISLLRTELENLKNS